MELVFAVVAAASLLTLAMFHPIVFALLEDRLPVLR